MKKSHLILILAVAVYTLYFSWLTISRHQSLFSGRYDLGNMEQTVWNTSQGRIFAMTNPGTSEFCSRLAFHADFLLVLVVPIYKIFPFTETLLVLQALLVALGAVPVFLIAKHIFCTLRDLIPLFFSILYLLSPIMQRANIYEFHSEVPGTTFLLFTFYFLLINRKKMFLSFFFLSLISKETVSLVLAAICFWGIIKNKNRALCFGLFAFCLFYFIVFVKFIIPANNASLGRHFALRQFSDGNENLSQVIKNYAGNPRQIIEAISKNKGGEYFLNTIYSTGGLAIFSPLAFLFSLPPMLINMIAKGDEFRSFNFQYSATAVCGLIISSIYGLQFLLRKVKKIIIFPLVSIILLYHLYHFSPLPLIGSSPYLDFLKYQYPAAGKINYWSSRIPSEKSVSATNNAGSHFAKRKNLFVFPSKIDKADYIIIAARSWHEPANRKEQSIIISKLRENINYKLLDTGEDFWLFEKVSRISVPE